MRKDSLNIWGKCNVVKKNQKSLQIPTHPKISGTKVNNFKNLNIKLYI